MGIRDVSIHHVGVPDQEMPEALSNYRMTPRSALLVDPIEDWASTLFKALSSGGHAVILTKDERAAIDGRLSGFELRDTLLVLAPGPSVRFGFVLRKPFLGTIADQALATGTALNIDECRVTTTDKLGGGAENRCTFENVQGWDRPWMHNAEAQAAYAQRARDAVAKAERLGRWPTNLLVVHEARCRRDGIKRVKGSATSKTFHEAYEGASPTGFIRGWSHPGNQHGDEDGLETVANWVCEEGCPAKLIDGQSGERPSTLTGRADPSTTHENPATAHPPNWLGTRVGGGGQVYADSGGASRFYPQFRNEDELFDWIFRLITPPV